MNILTPAAVLVLWSLIVLFWMAATRFPAMSKSGIDLKNAAPGGRGSDLEDQLPANVNWKSHNFTHLMESPTMFYAVIAILAISQAGDCINVGLAWGYTITRICHSIWQATVNKVSIRFLLFIVSTLFLLALAVRALLVTL